MMPNRRLAFFLYSAMLAFLPSCGDGSAGQADVPSQPQPAPQSPLRPSLPPSPPPPPVAVDPAFPAEAALIGLSGSGGSGAALVRLEGGVQRYVRPGADLTPGWHLASVDRFGATFSAQSGAERRLDLPRAGEPAGKSAGPQPAQTEEAPGKNEEERRARAQVAIQPFLKDGAIKGANITAPIADYPQLQTGDVVTSMFGEPILGDEHLYELAAAMGRRDGIKVTVERRGRTQTLSLAPAG